MALLIAMREDAGPVHADGLGPGDLPAERK
jgi:hypothetical protein